MIAVLADDFSGAAELAGAATLSGLTAEVCNATGEICTADVCCFDANSRSLPREAAVERVIEFATAIARLRPEWAYKKVDSLLRGHVAAEIDAMQAVFRYQRRLLCSANPSRGRVIRGGGYFVGETPLDETQFARDPHFPRTTSDVRRLLGEASAAIATPDATSTEDLLRLTETITPGTLPAGGVEFFEALLSSRGHERRYDGPPQLPGSRLFVCGSPAAWQSGRGEEASAAQVPLVLLTDIEPCVARTTELLTKRGSALLAVGDPLARSPVAAETIERRLATVVATVLRHTHVDNLLLEGGATARAVLDAIGWRRFRAAGQLAAGVVVLEPLGAAPAPRIVVKPGSYPWPPGVWANNA